MPLPFFSNISSHNQQWEPIYKALFEITFDLPISLGRPSQDVVLMLENATSINLPVTFPIEIAVQRFKYSTRAFVTLPKDTHITDIKIKFQLNQDTTNSVYVWNVLKAWYDKVWNSQTGETNLKRDTTGSIVVNQHDRTGKIIRRVTYKNAQILSIGDIELAWEDPTAIIDVEAAFVSDYFEDLYIDAS